MVDDILSGREPRTNAVIGRISGYEVDYTIVTRDNYRELLIDTGYYMQEEILD